MNINLLADLIRLARVGANTLGQNASPATMEVAWHVIGEAEKAVEEENKKALAEKEKEVKPEDAQPA